MAKRIWTGNKAVDHGLVTNNPGYQRKAMLYNVLANKVLADPRSLDARVRQEISRANNLLNAETTSLFEPVLDQVQQLYQQNPDLKDVPFETALSLVRGPINKTASEMSMIRGWHRGEVHHGVPVGAASAITRNLSYENWGDTLYEAGRKMPITSQAYSGLMPLSSPAHNIAHFDPISRQFFKGEGAHGAQIILPGTSRDDAIYSLIDQLTPQLQMSRFAGELDKPFLKELAAILNSDTGLNVGVKDFSSTLYHPTGRGSTVASYYNKYTTPAHLNAATNAAYGTTNAVQAADRMLGGGQIRSEREAKDARNAAARQSRQLAKTNTNTPASEFVSVITRPGTEDLFNSTGMSYDKTMSSKFV